MTTPAQELREAAKLMRERAQAVATEGLLPHPLPWRTAIWDNPRGGHVVEDAEGVMVIGSTRRVNEYVAGMRPGVALAVADLLEDAAALFERDVIQETPEGPCCAEPAACSGHGAVLYHQGCDGVVEDGTCQCFAKPLAIARAFLGTKEDVSGEAAGSSESKEAMS